MQGKVQHHQVYEAVVERISQEITSGHLKAGERLESTRKLAERFGVGQSSIREALRVLSYMGLVRVKHGSGVFVAEQPIQHANALPSAYPWAEEPPPVLRHLIELRMVVEPPAARWAAERATAAEREEIQQRCERTQQCLSRVDEFQRRKDFQEEDVEFHMAIVRATHNPFLIDPLERVHSLLRFGREITSHVPHLVGSALHFHPQITRSIITGDAQRAESFMRAHLEDVLWWLEMHHVADHALPPDALSGAGLAHASLPDNDRFPIVLPPSVEMA
jgi:GntR family transcriptional repressor for pyruvate dehydrogenase complex